MPVVSILIRQFEQISNGSGSVAVGLPSSHSNVPRPKKLDKTIGALTKFDVVKREKITQPKVLKQLVMTEEIAAMLGPPPSPPKNRVSVRGLAHQRLKTLNHANVSLMKAGNGLRDRRFVDSSYNPRAFFNAISVDSKRQITNREWLINREILNHYSSNLDEEFRDTQKVLNQRSIGYLTKFANMKDPKSVGVQASPLGMSENTYFRQNISTILVYLKKLAAKSIGIRAENLNLITDSRIVEVLKREYAFIDGESIGSWKKEDFGAIFSHLKSSSEPIVVDVTEFMAEHQSIEEGNGQLLKIFDEACKTHPKFEEKLRDQLVLSSIVEVGDKVGLYTTRLGKFESDNYVEGSIGEMADAFRDLVYHNGFTVGPNQLFEGWLESAPNIETVNQKVMEMTGSKDVRVTFPKDLSGLAFFDSFEQFFSSSIYQQFALCKEDKRPYVSVLSNTTCALLKGLEKEGVFERFEELELEELLQLSLNKMQAHMQLALKSKDALFAYSDAVQLIHAELSNILAVARPLDPNKFSSEMQRVTDMLPEGFPEEIIPEFRLENSGMRCLSSILSGCEELKDDSVSLNIAVQSDCYYESAGNLHASKKHHTHNFDSNALALGSTLREGEKLDLYVCEFHHNISNVLEEYACEDLCQQVDHLFENNQVSKQFTVAIDFTICRTDAPEIKEFLAHNQERIKAGELNVVFYRSAQKFDLMGMDNFNGGIVSIVNNRKSFDRFNEGSRGTRDASKVSVFNQQGLGFYQKYAQRELNDYRQAIMDVTAKLSQAESAENPLGLPRTMIASDQHKAQSMLQVAPNSDPAAVFLDIRNPWMEMGSDQAANFYAGLQMLLLRLTQENPGEYHIEARPSFGFNHSNVSLIGGEKLRLNLGLEGDKTIKLYKEMLVTLDEIFSEARSDYRDPRIFNRINENIAGLSLKTLFDLKVKENKGVILTKEEHLERAKIYRSAGSSKAERRALEAAGAKVTLKRSSSLEKRNNAKFLKEMEAFTKLLHHTKKERVKVLGKLGEIADLAEKYNKNVGKELEIFCLEEFEILLPSELEVISSSLKDALNGVRDKDSPSANQLKSLSEIARRKSIKKMWSVPQEFDHKEDVARHLLARMIIRDGKHRLTDFMSSTHHYLHEGKDMSGFDLIKPQGFDQFSPLVKLVVNAKGKGSLGDQLLRRECIQFSNMLKYAKTGDKSKFVQAAEELLLAYAETIKSLQTSKKEKKLSRKAASEIARPGSIHSFLRQFVVHAKQNPTEYMLLLS